MVTSDASPSNWLEKIPLKRAFLSVSDKSGLRELAQFLIAQGCSLAATGSTAEQLTSYGFAVKKVEEITGFPEILGGRVKTLHPKIFGAILAKPNSESDDHDLEMHRIEKFDLVVCNLYPFQETLRRTEELSALVENIDIGGVSLLRAAAKNFSRVGVLCDPHDYKLFMESVQKHSGDIPGQLRVELALKALSETATYDEVISLALRHKLHGITGLRLGGGPVQRQASLAAQLLDTQITYELERVKPLRYGENPHQKAALYRSESGVVHQGAACSLAEAQCVNGKELSYNNYLDMEHGIRLITEFRDGACVIIKHNLPCGVALGASPLDAYRKAFEGDPVSPFGGVVLFNRKVDLNVALALIETFLEVVVAPAFDPEALETLCSKKNLRIVLVNTQLPLLNKQQVVQVQGGFLVQDADDVIFDPEKLHIPTNARPSPTDKSACWFAYSVVKHVRSNAIVIANAQQTIAVGGGFTNRVDAVEYCLKKARLQLKGAVLASDAFFPFPDSIELLKDTGISAIIQPGGSVQDASVIDACNKAGIAMLITGHRHFKH
ncbi:MAG: bifunctional phosphoribosylaminoimidazolecarboxamide formyltransferase/IMP cyclohydrolase [Betaproteobacteria bacterium]|nr:bifunctional phosphoribosylaminoimidazolecarboxamide formyltransferase/IMP cyclohydrolase [Betaproteobacteria bacterium]